ncbi:Protein NLRC5 [Holothuria leucospilota]|uniref:Protein NLRC5 n=1 Tax=Holothuria leucospilota TaxID=206669 RepID=A0A9Q1BA73_HOLLE|nr:Protein NLRC5 [Holothuria leucospilota]
MEDCKEELDSTTEPSTGFGQFLLEVASLLTFVTVEKLATTFNYSPKDIEDYGNNKSPGYIFVCSLKEKGIINPSDITLLIDALKAIDLYGVAEDASRLFERLCGELKPNMEISSNTEAQSSFIKQLKDTYHELCNRVQPIPFIRDRLLCVNNVFVDSGIEYFHRVGAKEIWQPLDSYHEIFTDARISSTRFILFGEPGYGKSILALQFAYDWYKSCLRSPLKNVEILIFLKLRQLFRVKSIFTAVRQFLLPHESKLSEGDIIEILYSSKSVVIVLDGFDEYAHKTGKGDDDVTKIIKGRMFQKFVVILTTRPSYKPEDMAARTIQLRLTGFDSVSQNKYIEKALIGNDIKEIEKIKKCIEQNPILRDLCEVPLFFAMFSHMTHEKQIPVTFDSVTGFFRYMMGCFHEHMKNKLQDTELKMYIKLEKDHHKLDKVSFEALSGEKQEIVWMKGKLRKSIGKDLYDQYLQVGILIEEEIVIVNNTPGSPTSALIERKTQTTFYHKLFCEWFAAHYLSEYATKSFTLNFSKTVGKLDPFDLQYVFRFACGINPDASSKIIKHLQKLEGGDKFAVLCILERTGEIGEIKDTIRQICSEGMIISGYDSLLLQRSSMHLLEIASRNNFSIEYLQLSNCLQSVDLSTEAIRTSSGLALTSRIRVKKLTVNLSNRDMTEDEAIDILQFASMCPSLRELWYKECVPPRSFKEGPTLSTLRSRNVEVFWQWSKDTLWYILSLQSGRWQNGKNGPEPTSEEFERALSKRTEWRKRWTEEIYRTDIRNARETLRRRAEEDKVIPDKNKRVITMMTS